VAVTVSIGVACYPDHGSSIESIKEKADKAMYESKSAGKNRVTLFSFANGADAVVTLEARS
jgi:diguanylate cyclase (GGDEF)-like protein